jgi:hypothetical protein
MSASGLRDQPHLAPAPTIVRWYASSGQTRVRLDYSLSTRSAEVTKFIPAASLDHLVVTSVRDWLAPEWPTHRDDLLRFRSVAIVCIDMRVGKQTRRCVRGWIGSLDLPLPEGPERSLAPQLEGRRRSR